jgi:hypothetical protein
MYGIDRALPNDSYLAAIAPNANNPSAANPFATINDLVGLDENWSNTDFTFTSNRTHNLDGRFITENNVGGYDTNMNASGRRQINWAAGGSSAVFGVGVVPTGFEAAGGVGYYFATPGTKAYSTAYEFGGDGYIQTTLYDTAFSSDESGFLALPASGGGGQTAARIYHLQYPGTLSGFEANVFGERILSQSSGLNRLSVLNSATGIAFLSGAGATGYIGVADQDGMISWMDNGTVAGWGGIYNGSGTMSDVNTVATIPSGGTLEFAGDFGGTLLLLDGDTGKITFDGLVDPSGLQLTPQASNPGNAETLWSNSGDSNLPYWGANPFAFTGDNIYGVDGTLTAIRTLDGGGFNLTMNNLDRFTTEADSVWQATGGDITGGFFGNLSMTNVSFGPFSIKNVFLQGGDQSTSQIAGLQISDSVAFGGVFTQWQLTNNASGRSQEFFMTQNGGMLFSSDVPDLEQPYQFQYDDFNSTDEGSVRSRMGHFDDISLILNTLNDSMGWYTYKRRVDAAIDNADIFEAQCAVDVVAETLTMFVNENASGEVSRIIMQSDQIEISVDETGGPPANDRLGIRLTNTTHTVFDDISTKGMVYDADYSVAGTADPRWIPDWGAVQTAIGAIVDNSIYTVDGTVTGNRTVNLGTNQLTFNNGDVLIESASAGDYIAMLGGQVILGASGDVWVDTGVLQLGGPLSPGDPTIIFNDTASAFSGTLENTALSAARTWTLPNITGTLLVGSGSNDYSAIWSSSGLSQGFLRDNGTSLSAGVALSATDTFRIRAQAGDSNVIRAEHTIAGATTFGLLALNSGASTQPVGGSLEAFASAPGGVAVGGRMLSNGVCTYPAGVTSIGGVAYAVVNSGNTGDTAAFFACADDSHADDNFGLIVDVSNGGAGNAYIGKFTDGNEAAGAVMTSDASGNANWGNPFNVASPYTVTNVTTDRTYDADSSSVDELADVLGTVIADLQSVGILS